MTTISANLQAVRARIAETLRQAERAPGDAILLAVSKTWPAEALREAAACGQKDFGENYLQEALTKQLALQDLDLVWHFIGPLQSNKTTPIAQNFQWVHGVDRLKIAQRLSAARGEMGPGVPPLQVCLQVNVSGEASKSGVAPEEVPELARTVASLPHLSLRGLMAIPEPTPDLALLRSRFALLRGLLRELNAGGLSLDTLSMGMSADLEPALLEGATIVRVGSAIFGERHSRESRVESREQ
ncbi:MAG: YggS family pyridoxal phosphate-dependent enzyme [Rhodocyclaceae bacterium]|nr:YggS family pyridoxal phosphate-dependent enzyme [Rhodocyclaceae bacterium]